MPVVKGHHYSYTPAGYKAAAAARKGVARPPVDRGSGKANAPGQIKKAKSPPPRRR